MIRRGPVLMSSVEEEMFLIPTDGEPIVPTNMAGLRSGLEDRLLVSGPISKEAPEVLARVKVIPDGNRGALISDSRIELPERTYVLGIKGIGARMPMFGNGPIPITGRAGPSDATFTSEYWFGENPWGAMSEKACREDKAITELSGPNGINGFLICPMVRANPLPDWIMKDARPRFWYRRLDTTGPYYQQTRLLPSDVRLYHQAEATLGRKTHGVLRAFGVFDVEEMDGFIDNYIRSGLAALTLIMRTVRPCPTWGHRALDYDDVWLDKDSVMAPDGSIYFADIEGLDWIPVGDEEMALKRIVRQFNRNYYELMFGLDCLLQERERITERPLGQDGRRLDLATRMELALMGDAFIQVERSATRLDLVLKATEGPVREATIKMLDFDKEGSG